MWQGIEVGWLLNPVTARKTIIIIERRNSVTLRHAPADLREGRRVRGKRMVVPESAIFIVCSERPTGGNDVKDGVGGADGG